MALLAVQGIRLSYGAFMVPWEKHFSADRSTISLISTLSFVVYGAFQPIVGNLIGKFGARAIIAFSTALVGVSMILTSFATSPWQLFILCGVFVSIGVAGASNVTTSVIVTDWFHEKRGLAFGLMEAGFGAGQMLLVPASLFLIAWLDWKWTALILGVLLVIVILPIAWFVLRDHPSEKGTYPIGGDHYAERNSLSSSALSKGSSWSILRTRQFWYLVLPFAICGFTTTGLMDTHLIPFSHAHGFSNQTTGTAVFLLAACNIIGILISGVVADRWDNRKTLFFLYVTRALSLLILIHSHETWVLLAFAILFGLVDFATVAPTQMLATQYFKNQSVGMMLGWLFFSHQVGSALGAFLPGLIYNEVGNYSPAFYAAIIVLVIASVMNLLLPPVHQSAAKLAR